MQTAWDIASQERDAQLRANESHPLGLVPGSPDGFHAIAFDGGYFKLMPGPEFNSWIFRGQEKFFNPCKPSMYRGGKEKLDFFVDRMKCVQFEHVLHDHPAIVDCRDGLVVMGNRLWIDYEGLAQHYGLATELMDFSSDPWVAAFFAVSWFDVEAQRYVPIRSGEEGGVFYRLNLAMDFMEPNKRVSEIVGMQPLVRPGEQKAFSVRVKKGRCLHNVQSMGFQRFRHDTLVSERILERFSWGSDLLPEDPVARKAAEIASMKVFSRHAFSECVARYFPGIDKGSLLKRLKRRGVVITEGAPCDFTQSEIVMMREEWMGRRDRFASSIKYRLVSSHYNGQASS
ncbi:FRG domain-containing protein [Halomonas desiderata]|uniref:FRG domain-containing protein n=1 Tax=Billgrantia desiderata TaxID=52021 RepID=UPI00174D8942|nr:FRG domain-containing protein [Halomonas desiderata]